MSNLVDYAESELQRIGMGADTSDEMNKLMHDNIIQVVKIFAEQGHSGFSAGYALGILKNVLNFEPVTPLTGEDDEWELINEQMGGREGLYQNKRCSHVFKEDGQAYDSEGRIFYPTGQPDLSYTGASSHVPVTFPYTPTREYVEVEE
jgi:hypothetical protein